METIKFITYNSSVFVSAGWRNIEIQALAKTISQKMAEVVTVVNVDGNGTTGYASRTGAKRQTYHVKGIAQREIGKRKRIACCNVI